MQVELLWPILITLPRIRGIDVVRKIRVVSVIELKMARTSSRVLERRIRTVLPLQCIISSPLLTMPEKRVLSTAILLDLAA